MENLLKAFFRTKYFTTAEIDETRLKRCLSLFDLTALGVGATLGAGVYVATGEVARNQAGPAIVISFAIAATASLLSGLCYAEFGARVPKAGSAYIYSYVTIGELCAFVTGWTMLLEYMVGSAAIGKAWSEFFNYLCHDCAKEFIIKHIGSFKLHRMADYPDFLAFTFIIVLTVVVICGIAESSALNWVFTILNLSVILFATVAGLAFAEPKNWNNFAPFGFNGIMSGAATCFFAFVGFDVIATLGEETKNPRKAIPRATVATLFIVFVAYECISVALTLMVPHTKLPKSSALATVFEYKAFPTGKYIVAVGAICGISSSALNAMSPQPRILYSMASDGLIFSFFATVNKRTGTPVIACAVSGLFTALLAMIFDLAALVEALSIGTLLSYTMVSISVILLRYKPGSVVQDTNDKSAQMLDDVTEPEFDEDAEIAQESDDLSESFKNVTEKKKTATPSETRNRMSDENKIADTFFSDQDPKSRSVLIRVLRRILGRRLDVPTEDSCIVVKIALAVFLLDTIGLQSCLIWGMDRLTSKDPLMIVLFVLFLMWMLLAVDVIARQPESKNELRFKVPFLPFIPLVAIFVNVFLLLELQTLTWIRFAIWMVLGMIIYLSYGIKYSTQNEEIVDNNGASYMELTNSIEDEN